MDRAILKAQFLEKSPPDWVCPECRKSLLKIKLGTFHKAETLASRQAKNHEAWDPEWVRYVYSCLLECTNESCREVVSTCGRGSVSYDVKFDSGGEPDYEFADFFQPLFFEPPLHLINLPQNCPPLIEAELLKSFASFFGSPDSALNSARAAIELLLNDLGVKRFNVVAGKRRPINLHTRITMLPAQHAHVKDLLTAIKWLGNAGSHPGIDISSDDVIDAYELIEHVLGELYNGKAKAMKALARRVNKRKGPTR